MVTGVAGSGKSSLVNGVFAKEYPEAITIDQSAVAGNIRSNPATYSGIMNDIRKLFSQENKVSAGLFPTIPKAPVKRVRATDHQDGAVLYGFR